VPHPGEDFLGIPREQGRIVDTITEDDERDPRPPSMRRWKTTYYLVQHFEWVTDAPEPGLKLVRADEMASWTFYRSADDMRAAFGLYDGVRRFLRRRAAGDGDARCPTCGR
jgi:hypothetical protein